MPLHALVPIIQDNDSFKAKQRRKSGADAARKGAGRAALTPRGEGSRVRSQEASRLTAGLAVRPPYGPRTHPRQSLAEK